MKTIKQVKPGEWFRAGSSLFIAGLTQSGGAQRRCTNLSDGFSEDWDCETEVEPISFEIREAALDKVEADMGFV